MSGWPDELRFGDPVTLPAKTVVASEGRPIATIYLVESGVVSLARRSDGADILIGFRSSGAALGAACAAAGACHGATISSLTDVSVRMITVAAFHDACRSNVDAAAWLNGVLAAEIDDQARFFVGLSARSAKERILAVLADLFRKYSEARPDRSRRLLVPETIEHLAIAVRITRERASQILAELAADAVLVRDAKGWFVAPRGSELAGP